MGELQISDGRPEVLQELAVAFGLHGLNPEWEQGHSLAQKDRSLGTGKTGRQDHHLLAGEAVHSTEVIDRFARSRGQPLAVHLYQDAPRRPPPTPPAAAGGTTQTPGGVELPLTAPPKP